MNTALAAEKPGPLHLVLMLAAMIILAPAGQLVAQGLDTKEAIEAILGSSVNTTEEPLAEDEDRIIAAIERTSENTGEVRKRFNMDRIDIVFVPEFGEEETAVEAKAAEFQVQITELHNEIQGSAIFYHAVDSRSVLLTDVIALEFDDDNGVTIFVAGSEPGTASE